MTKEKKSKKKWRESKKIEGVGPENRFNNGLKIEDEFVKKRDLLHCCVGP